MQKRHLLQQRPNEQGQTIVLVAISLVSLLAMAALAIDIVTLYVARSEIQRAADAAALAGAKAIADSGITSLLLTDPNFTTVQTWAAAAATNQANAVLQNNLVAGAALGPIAPTVDWTRQGNPHVTVSLQSFNLPTFFSKIWSRSSPTVAATATAEVYNPSNLPTITPIAPKSVKPWLVANADPFNAGLKLVDTTTWAVDSGLIGTPFDLVSDCNSGVSTQCSPLFHATPQSNGAGQLDYVPALVSPPSVPNPNVCPPCAGATDYEQSIECADVSTSYQVISCGGGTAQAQWDNTINPGPSPGNNATALGAQCLIHASNPGPGQGQDLLQNLGPWPAAPFQYKAQSGSQNGNLVTTSNSIVTIPILDRTFDATTSNVIVAGFLQAFINQVDLGPGPPAPGSINITVLNIAGCSSTNNGANPVVGGSGTSPVPVRLITPP